MVGPFQRTFNESSYIGLLELWLNKLFIVHVRSNETEALLVKLKYFLRLQKTLRSLDSFLWPP